MKMAIVAVVCLLIGLVVGAGGMYAAQRATASRRYHLRGCTLNRFGRMR